MPTKTTKTTKTKVEKEEKVKSKVKEGVKIKKEKKEAKKTKKTEIKEKETKKVEKKEVKKTTKKTSTKAPTTMEELLESTGYELKAPKRGEVVSGLITDISKKMVLVDIGGKTEGMVVDKEYEAVKDMVMDMTVGDEIEVYVLSPENDRGQILLSLRKAAVDKKWEMFEEYLGTGDVVDVYGLEVNRGGLIVQTDGVRGFVPSSQFGTTYLGKMEKLLSKRFKVKVIEVDKEKNRLIFSERHVSEAEAMAQKTEALDKVVEKETYEGVVSGIMPFGAFVTVNVPLNKKGDKVAKVEGLIHISEISWEKVSDPNNHFKVGDKLKVMVIGVNEDNGKLNLSVKRLENDPWSEIESKYVVGNKVGGKVTRVAPFGVFVTLEPGVDGLIHISKVPSGEEPKVGEELDVYVESLDKDNRRMSLGVVLTEVPVGYK
ncbi:30S ribosomal protein S1 [Patescibacteria group bacterium]